MPVRTSPGGQGVGGIVAVAVGVGVAVAVGIGVGVVVTGTPVGAAVMAVPVAAAVVTMGTRVTVGSTTATLVAVGCAWGPAQAASIKSVISRPLTAVFAGSRITTLLATGGP